MRRLFIYIGVLVMLLLASSRTYAMSAERLANENQTLADSIMRKVAHFAPYYEKMVCNYEAELYVKGRVDLKKKNFLIRFVPSMFNVKKGVREYLMESYSDLKYTTPNIYDQKLKATMGTTSDFWELDGHLPDYFHINVYSSTLLNDKLLSPLAGNAHKFYKFKLETVMGNTQGMFYRISFTPKFSSYQLVKGFVVINSNGWSVREFQFSGQSEILKFHHHVKMGKAGEPHEFLPVSYNLIAEFRFMGNVAEAQYLAVLNYKSIIQESSLFSLNKRIRKCDLTESYTLRADTNSYRNDTAYFNTLRPLSLSLYEKQLYEKYFRKADTLSEQEHRKEEKRNRWGKVGKALTNRYTLDLDKVGNVRFSPLINPLLLSYSKTNGISYRQELRYSQMFNGDRLLRLRPQIGYNFNQKEFYWKVNSSFEYWPQKRTSIHFEVGNGNRIYSSSVLNALKTMPNSGFDFTQINLDYFKDLYLKLRHSWEIVNGVKLDVGFAFHRRTEINRSRFVIKDPVTGEEFEITDNNQSLVSPDILQKIRGSYNSFAPRVTLTWTPGQYYYMNGNRKINLHSRYPQFSVDWERGIKGVFGSTGSYERWEIDLQHRVRFGVMSSLSYRLGWGAFTNQEELYFVDFSNLSRSNLPVGWNDDIGGVFQLLDARWYNSSRYYLRGHLTYESPFLLMPALKEHAKYVLNERIYLNVLTMPRLKPYMELGYGIGTHLFDFGVFVGLENWRYNEIGCKFTFELFNR